MRMNLSDEGPRAVAVAEAVDLLVVLPGLVDFLLGEALARGDAGLGEDLERESENGLG